MTAEPERQGVHQSERQWLVRSVENRITGPFTLEQVRAMIEQGKLTLGDELCNANSYWFYLHEAQEVRAQLGMELPQQFYVKATEERTDTQTDTTDLDQDGIEAGATRMASRSQAASREPDLPELDSDLEDIGENTAVMSNRAFRDYRHKKTATQAAPQPVGPLEVLREPHPAPAHRGPGLQAVRPEPLESSQGWLAALFEHSRLLHILAYIMMAGAVVLVIAVIKLLQRPPG